MHVSSFVAVALAATPLLVSAAPARFYGKRDDADVLVVKFADALEQLESHFYLQALQKFQPPDFINAGFKSSDIPIQQLQGIQNDEATHAKVLESALKSLGETPISGCKFNFDSALTDVTTMAATARVVEFVGVSAYTGALHLLTNPIIISAAASIATVEARHQTMLNVLSVTGTAIPSSFDLPLSPSEVSAIASSFVSDCDLGVPANQPLTITNKGTVQPGTLLTFSSPALNSSTDGLFCQMMVGGSAASISLPLKECVVPQLNGPVAIWITRDDQPLLNDVVDRATADQLAGPTIAFIDTDNQALGQAVAGGDSGSPTDNGSSSGSSSDDGSVSTSISTTTISPADASSIIASAASATQTGSAGAATPAIVAGTVSSVTLTSGSATATGSAAAPASSSSGDSSNPAVNATPGQPNMFTGNNADGSITVVGWSQGSPASN